MPMISAALAKSPWASFERGPNFVLQLPVLHDAVKRALADAEHAGGFLAVAAGQLQRLLHVVAFDLAERPADQVRPDRPARAVGQRQLS